jgi:Gpi18-like mannosyltransferase
VVGHTREKEPILRIARLTPALVIVVLAVVVRVELFPFQSNDYRVFVAQWYDFIAANGGFSALRFQFANYNVPYLYLITLLTYLPVPALAGVKIISVLFDLLLAFFTYRLVALKYPRGWMPFLAAAAVSLLPTVVTNGAMWAQCDSIYAAFGLGGVYYAVRSRPWLACVFFGLALAFKMQIVFLFPLLLVLALMRKLPWPALLVVPGVVLLMDGPALLAGADPGQLLTVYTDQVGEYTQLTLNAPNVYQFLGNDVDANLLRTVGVVVTAVLVLAVVFMAVASRARLTVSRVVLLAALFAILVPFFLPAMHERYFFVADVLSVIIAFYLPRRLWPVPLLVQFASFLSYLPFLNGLRTGEGVVDFGILTAAMAVALALVVWEFVAGSQVQLETRQDQQQQRATGQLAESVRGQQAEG